MNLIDGQRFLKEKKFDKSLKIFLYLEKKNCSDPRIFFYLGLIYFELNQFDKSISYYKKFLIKNPSSTNALLNLAIVKQSIGKIDYAKKIYLKLIKKNKLNVKAYYGLYLLDPKNFAQKNFEILKNIEKDNKLNLHDLSDIKD